MRFPMLLGLLMAVAVAGCSEGEETETPAAAASGQPGTPSTETDFASLTGDAAHGEDVFRRCAACHSVEPGQTRIGPSLAGVVGRDIGSVAGFRYSPANQATEGEWTPERLFEYLEDPRSYMPGTTMSFAGISDAQNRADLIAYLETLS